MLPHTPGPNPLSQTTDEDFDPHDERKVEHTITDWETLVHFLKGCIGTGILSMPIAFSHIGLLAGTILTFAVGAMCSYGLQLLITTEYKLCKRLKVGYLPYPEAMKVAVETGPAPFRCIAPITPHVVNVFLVLYQLGLCTAYLVFVSINIKSVVEHYTDTCWAIQVYMCIFFVGCLAISFVPTLKMFAPFSLFANLFILASLSIIIYYVLQDFPSPLKRDMIRPVKGWVRFLGICFFALESVGVVVEAESHMKNPKHFCGWFGVLNIAIMTVTFLYWLIGFLGYTKYGDDIKSTIPLNLPDGILTSVCRILVTIAILVSFGLQLFPAQDVIFYSYIAPRVGWVSQKRYWCYIYLVKTGCALVVFGFACASDKNLELVLALLGVVCITMLGFFFPAMMHACTTWPTRELGPYCCYLVRDVAIMAFGLCIAILGLYVNIASVAIEEAAPQPGCS